MNEISKISEVSGSFCGHPETQVHANGNMYPLLNPTSEKTNSMALSITGKFSNIDKAISAEPLQEKIKTLQNSISELKEAESKRKNFGLRLLAQVVLVVVTALAFFSFIFVLTNPVSAVLMTFGLMASGPAIVGSFCSLANFTFLLITPNQQKIQQLKEKVELQKAELYGVCPELKEIFAEGNLELFKQEIEDQDKQRMELLDKLQAKNQTYNQLKSILGDIHPTPKPA